MILIEDIAASLNAVSQDRQRASLPVSGAPRLAFRAQTRCGGEDDEMLVPREERVCAGCPAIAPSRAYRHAGFQNRIGQEERRVGVGPFPPTLRRKSVVSDRGWLPKRRA